MIAREQRIAALLAHPRFPEARRLQIDGYLSLYAGEAALNKLLLESARHLVVTFVVCLAARHRDDDPDTWLTLTRLQDIVTGHQVGSPSLVEAIVARMIDRGLLTSTPAPGDRRKRILAPTQALMAHDRDLIVVQAAPCMLLAPSPGLALAMARDTAFQNAARIASVDAFGDAMAMLAEHRDMMLFMARDSGLMALYMLLASAEASPGRRTSSVSYQEIADRFGVSRTHVRDMVRDAEHAGLVSITAEGGAGIEIAPRLWRMVDHWIAACMELFMECCMRAYASMAATNPGPAGPSRPQPAG